jgi:hypothetical protein
MLLFQILHYFSSRLPSYISLGSRLERTLNYNCCHSLPPSPLCTIPNSMIHIGDKTNAYAALRQDLDPQELFKMEPKLSFAPMERKDTGHQVAYHPVKGYPYE